jgi:hypothetical protein
LENDALSTLLKEDIYFKNTVLEKMEEIKKIDPTTPEFEKLYADIINVGEYKISIK